MAAERPALVLLAHGSPDPDWRRPIEQLRDRIRDADPEARVEIAYMEFVPPDLAGLARMLADSGCRRAIVLSVFLSPGGNHLKKHVPELVERASATVPELELVLQPGALGAEPEVLDALAAAALRLSGEP